MIIFLVQLHSKRYMLLIPFLTHQRVGSPCTEIVVTVKSIPCNIHLQQLGNSIKLLLSIPSLQVLKLEP